MKRILLAALALLLLVTLYLITEDSGADDWREIAQPPLAGQRAAHVSAELASATDEDPGRRSDVQRGPSGEKLDGGSDESEPGGEFRILSESEFKNRLRQLGLGDSGSIFDRIHEQRNDLGAVFVLVTGEGSVAVEEARVSLDPASSEDLRARVGSGSFSDKVRREGTGVQGVALFTNVDPGSHLLTVEHQDYLTRYFGSIESRAGERTYIEAELKGATSHVSGIVTNESGVPIAGARIAASHYTEGGVIFSTGVITGFSGEFKLGVVAGSQNLVEARKLGYEDVQLEFVAADTDNLRITMIETEIVEIEGFCTRGNSLEPVTLFSIDGEIVQDSEGRFSVERNVSAEPLSLTFDAEGFATKIVSVSVAENRNVDLGQVPLFGQRELTGIVLLEDDEGTLQPVGGALVSVETDSLTTLEDGLFAFRDLGSETVRLSVSAPGAGLYENEIELLEDEPTYVEVVLSRGEYSVSGTVVDDGSDEPIAGAKIEVIERPDIVALTSEAGFYEITGIPLAQFALRASKSGYEDEISGGLQGVEEGTTWDARMMPSGLRVRFQANGAPVPAGVSVVLWKRIEPTLQAAQAAQAAIDSHRFTSATDEEGGVTFDVEDGEYFVQVPSYRLHPTLVQASGEQADWISMALPGTTQLEGRITNSDGSAVANTSVWLHSGDQDYSTMFLYHTDNAGNYTIPNLAARPYALSIIKSVADQSAQHVTEFVASGSPTQNNNVTLPPLTSSVSGRLTDENGAPKAGVMIGVEFLDAQHRSILAGWVGTDAAGNFTIPRLEPGRHILRTAWGDDEAAFSAEFTLGVGEHREIDLVEPRVTAKNVSGHMIASDGGPLGANFVFVTDDQGRQNGNFFSTMDWAYVGSFNVGGLSSGGYALDLTAMGCRKQSRNVQVGGSVSGVLVEMERE